MTRSIALGTRLAGSKMAFRLDHPIKKEKGPEENPPNLFTLADSPPNFFPNQAETLVFLSIKNTIAVQTAIAIRRFSADSQDLTRT